MKVLGIDPGTARAGWAFVEKSGVNPTLLSYGCFETSKNKSIEIRLLLLYTKMQKIIAENKPDVLAIEDLFYTTNAKTVITVAQARGVILLAASQKKILTFSYSPLAIKLAVAGYGKAEKRQVQQMVKNILKLDSIPRPDDAADAVAVALTHMFTKRF